MKKVFLSAIMLVMVFTTLVACSGNNNSSSDSTKNNSGTNESPPIATDLTSTYKDFYDPPVNISTVWGVDPNLTFKNGETIENNVATRWAKETLGIEVETLWSVSTVDGAYETRLRLAMTSPNDMPDIVSVTDPLLANELIESGMFREVGTLFDEYANEQWKGAINLDPAVWNAYIRDGERMAIPILDYAYNWDHLLWIRQDWLDALDLEAPTTLDELEVVMDAFKHNNPDGLSPNDVVPLSVGLKAGLKTWMGELSWLFGAYGTLPEQWNVDDNGNLEYGSINAGAKDALLRIKSWRDKGYIPSEAALWDENKTAEPAVAGTAGIIPGPYWMSGWPLSDTVKNVSHAVWKPHLIPAGPDGTIMRHGTHFVNGITLINKNMKHPEAFFTYQNYLFANLADPDPGSVFDLGVFKGYDYDLDANGNPLYLDDVPGGAITAPLRYFLVRDGARIPDASFKALLNIADGKEPTRLREKDVVANYGPETGNAAVKVLEQEQYSFKDMYVGPPTETMKTRSDYLSKLEQQVFNEVIYGTKGPEAFDEFVADWKSSGGDDITKEVNAWYQSIK
jgi:putative aldouronate transport system substrate-binding protein